MKKDKFLTSAKAANILGVHESSVKRWCNSNTIQTELTDGGHRRIKWDVLVEFANSKNIPLPYQSFAEDSFRVYQAKNLLLTKNDPKQLQELVFEWTYSVKFRNLYLITKFICQDLKFPFSSFCDMIIFPSLVKLGEWWEKEELSTAEEHIISNEWIFALSSVRRSFAMKRKDDHLKAIVACSNENLHEIPAQCIRIILESLNIETTFLGARTPVSEIVNTQQQNESNLLCLSFSPLDHDVEINKSIEHLVENYQIGKPYYLVLGGNNIDKNNVENKFADKKPFVDIQHFKKLVTFEEWVVGKVNELSPV
jgi:MerR family transcriptional regulator, light-induced transcriptional regulator